MTWHTPHVLVHISKACIVQWVAIYYSSCVQYVHTCVCVSMRVCLRVGSKEHSWESPVQSPTKHCTEMGTHLSECYQRSINTRTHTHTHTHTHTRSVSNTHTMFVPCTTMHAVVGDMSTHNIDKLSIEKRLLN